MRNFEQLAAVKLWRGANLHGEGHCAPGMNMMGIQIIGKFRCS